MKLNRLTPLGTKPPFLLRRLALIFIFSVFVCGTAFGSDIQQVNAEDNKKLLKQADRLIKQGNFVEASKIFRKVLETNPTDSSVKLKLARALLKQRSIVDAYDISYAVVESEPENAHAYAVLGTSLLSAGRFAEARQVLFTALRLDKKEALAWAGFGLLEFYENRIDDSLQNLREAVFHDPNQPDFVFALAQVSARAERYAEAADAYNRFLSISKNTDDERRARIRGLIDFLRFLGYKRSLYQTAGPDNSKVKFSLIGNRPVIELRINERDEPFRFVLDTGSGISVISEETAARLKMTPITRGGFAKGIGGNGRFEIVYGFLREVEVGEVKIRNVPVYIRKFHSNVTRVDGYIGLALISKFLTTIDYGDQTFSLTKKDSEGAITVKNGISVPLRLTSSGFLSGEVVLEGVENPLNFIVDTGASVSVISDEVASLESVSSFERGARMRVIGAAGVTEDVPSYLLPKVSFGTHSRTSIAAIALDLDMINEASGFEQAGILGGNFLRNYRMTFDFKNSKVTFEPVVQEP